MSKLILLLWNVEVTIDTFSFCVLVCSQIDFYINRSHIVVIYLSIHDIRQRMLIFINVVLCRRLLARHYCSYTLYLHVAYCIKSFKSAEKENNREGETENYFRLLFFLYASNSTLLGILSTMRSVVGLIDSSFLNV